MIWVCLLLVSLAVMLVKLGAMSVWVTVLTSALQVGGGLLVLAMAIAAWRHFQNKRR